MTQEINRAFHEALGKIADHPCELGSETGKRNIAREALKEKG